MADMQEWLPIRTGESGDLVYRRADGGAFAKVARPDRKAELEGERDRLVWLERHGIASPRVLDWRESEFGNRLVTTTIPGVPAGALSGEDLIAAWPSIAEAIGALHLLDAQACPFDRGLASMLARARSVVARDAVNPDFLAEEDVSLPATTLLARIEGEVPARLVDEKSDCVVCHGDATMPNLMVDPVRLRCTGVIDLGRLGTADRYVDLSLMLASAGECWTSRGQVEAAFDTLFGVLGIDQADRGRLAFYLRLDPLTWG